MCEEDKVSKVRYNIEYIHLNNKKEIYVCLNHRVAYLCWIDALKSGLIKKGSLLFHIDYHADISNVDLTLIEDPEKINETKVKDFVKNKLNLLNDNFIFPAIYNGIIGDVISIHQQDLGYPYPEKKGFYDNTNGYEIADRQECKHIFYLGGSSIKQLTGYDGLLTDRCKHKDVQKAFEESVKNQNIILDIDLDFFTYQDNEGKTWAMNDRNLQCLLDSEGFNYVYDKIGVVTLALEPACCGRNVECLSIFEKLSSYIFTRSHVDIKSKTMEKFSENLS